MNAVEYVSAFSRFGKKSDSLDRIRSLLASLGDPQKKLKFIHIAGTNGKGSMAEMFSEILVEQGYKTGLFTSPYILEYADRIRINGRNIPYETLDGIAEKIAPVIDSHPLRDDFSQFEITQAIAFIYYAEQNCDVVVLETGLGGLADSTNIIDAPLVSVIGSVSYDHTAILGETLEEIAFQKAGILKNGCPCVLAPENAPEAVAVVRKKAEETGSLLVIPDIDEVTVEESDIFGSRFAYKGESYEISMSGSHQIRNAVTVIEAMEVIKDKLYASRESIATGLKNAKLFGRTEVISREPLIILDGAHNPDGTAALAGVLKESGGVKPHGVIGMRRDKNAFDAVKNIVPYIEHFTVVEGFCEGAFPADELADIIRQAGGKADAAKGDACGVIRELSDKTEGIVICGSLYLVSYVKNKL